MLELVIIGSVLLLYFKIVIIQR